jgi:hypothetical protein
MRWLLRRPVRSVLWLMWVGLVVVTLAVRAGWLRRTGEWGSVEPMWQYERREIVAPGWSGERRTVGHADVARFAGNGDGAQVLYKAAAIRESRGVLQITATLMAYSIDDAPGATWSGLRFYYMDHGEPTRNPFYFHGEERERGFYRFPMSMDDWSVWDGDGQYANKPPNYRPRYTFVRSMDGKGGGWRTADLHTTGWDLDVRIPFWLILTVLATVPGSALLLRGVRGLRRRRRRLRGLCERCAYDLRGGGSARCPECGEAAGGGA